MLNQKLRRVCRSTHKCYVCSALLYSSLLLRLHLVYCHLSICVRACSLTRLLMPSSSCVGGSGMGRVDRLSGRDRGNEIIAELLLLLSLLCCSVCLWVYVRLSVCVCVHVCLALFSAKIYIKIALHLTSTLLNEAHESGGRHVVCALSPSISLSHSLGHSTALL